MIQGVIGQDYKSPLMFLEKLPKRKGICSKVYLQQVLEPIVFLLFDDLGLEYIYIEDGSKVHLGKARLPRLQHSVYSFKWPPSSPDLNPIKKVQRQMKEEMKKLLYVPKNREDICRELQALQDWVDLVEFRHYTEQLTCKIEDVIRVRGLATIN